MGINYNTSFNQQLTKRASKLCITVSHCTLFSVVLAAIFLFFFPSKPVLQIEFSSLLVNSSTERLLVGLLFEGEFALEQIFSCESNPCEMGDKYFKSE